MVVLFTFKETGLNQSCFFLYSVPSALVACTDFIEKEAMVDGVYRISGIASNIKRLRSVKKFIIHVITLDDNYLPKQSSEKMPLLKLSMLWYYKLIPYNGTSFDIFLSAPRLEQQVLFQS